MKIDLLSILTFLLIVSLFANLFFINLKIFGMYKEKNIQKNTPEIVKKYLGEQAYKTENYHKFNYIPKLHNVVVKFRSAYLKIEEKCIDREVDSAEYWNLANSKIFSLINLAAGYLGSKPLLNIKKKIALIKKLVSESDNIKDKQRVMDCLDKFYKVCDNNSNENKIAEYDKKLNKIILRFTDKYYAKMDQLIQANDNFLSQGKGAIEGLERSIGNVESISNAVVGGSQLAEETLKECRENNQSLKEGVATVSESLYALEQKVYSLRDADGLQNSGESANNSARELQELSELIQRENEKEISRLRSIVEQQKSVIVDLEGKLREIIEELEHDDSSTEGEKSRHKTIIEGLRGNLRDAENCILTLEQEIQNLKVRSEQIQTGFSGLGENEILPVGQSEVDNLEEVVEDLRLEIESKSRENETLKTISQFANEIYKGETYEDLSLLLYETLMTLDLNVVLKIYAPTRTFDICGAGKIPLKLSTIIDSMLKNETNVNNQSFFFKFSNVGGAVQSSRNKKLSEAEKAHILLLTELANKMFDIVRFKYKNKTQLQKLEDCENNIKKTFSSVDTAFEKINYNAIKAVEESFRQVKEVARSSGVNATQIARLSALESDAIAEINSQTATKLKVRKSFLETLKEIESLYS